MGYIDWDEFKRFKEEENVGRKLDNFQMLLEFMRSYYNKSNAFELYDILTADELASMMLIKRDIKEAEDLETYLFKVLRT